MDKNESDWQKILDIKKSEIKALESKYNLLLFEQAKFIVKKQFEDGVKLLDAELPNWAKRVDINRFYEKQIVIDQLFNQNKNSSYKGIEAALAYLFDSQSIVNAQNHGFGIYEYYWENSEFTTIEFLALHNYLKELWTEEVKRRNSNVAT